MVPRTPMMTAAPKEPTKNSLRRPTRSLKSLLTLWFLLFSIVPLAFVTGYSMVQFESAISDELFKRLRGNAREISTVFTDLEDYLKRYSTIHASDASLVYHLSTASFPAARKLIQDWMRNYSASRMAVADKNGKLVIVLGRDEMGIVKNQTNLEAGDYYLPEELTKKIDLTGLVTLRDFNKTTNSLELIVYNRILSKRGQVVGYLEEIISVDKTYLDGLRKRLNLEIFLLDRDVRARVSTADDFLIFPKDFFSAKMNGNQSAFFDITNRGIPYGVKIEPLTSEENSIYLGLGASKKDVTNRLKGINRALFTIVGVIILLLVFTLLAASNLVLKPLNNLVEAAQKMAEGKFGTQIPSESDTEIGLLTESFNVMSSKVAEARTLLENKIQELESVNQELRETQAQLVHSAKMVSLGQLVAGVAHELNNPIGFIYSNMTHLKDYSERFEKLIKTSQENPQALEKLKTELEYEFILQDMPRLIKSCEDGARRVRDIVISLRNFSRLDESQVKEVDINEAVENTLQLLSGEMKNRIQIHKNFSQLPKLKCYSSQINQVLMNILANAAQAIEGDGEIWVSTAADSTQLEIKIRDSGKGMSEKTIEKIFDPFFTTKPVGQGTGLGLSISYGIVKRHGGEIKVNSTIGKGTEFSIFLPLNGLVNQQAV